MPSLALFVHHVADLDEGGLLLVVAKAIRRYIRKYNLPDPFCLQMVVDLVGDVSDARPGVKQDGGDERLLVLEGSHLEPGLEVADEVLSEGVAHDDEAVFNTGVAIPEGGKGEAGNSNLGDLMAQGGNVI